MKNNKKYSASEFAKISKMNGRNSAAFQLMFKNKSLTLEEWNKSVPQGIDFTPIKVEVESKKEVTNKKVASDQSSNDKKTDK